MNRINDRVVLQTSAVDKSVVKAELACEHGEDFDCWGAYVFEAIFMIENDVKGSNPAQKEPDVAE